MRLIARFALCLVLVLVVSALSALAWDRSEPERAASEQQFGTH